MRNLDRCELLVRCLYCLFQLETEGNGEKKISRKEECQRLLKSKMHQESGRQKYFFRHLARSVWGWNFRPCPVHYSKRHAASTQHFSDSTLVQKKGYWLLEVLFFRTRLTLAFTAIQLLWKGDPCPVLDKMPISSENQTQKSVNGSFIMNLQSHSRGCMD